MKCKQCGAESEIDARFCKNCGSNLAGRTIQPDCGQKAKAGGFHRFCLATAAIWTFFMLGSLLAMGISLVNHGVIDPTAFGLGLGMGFTFLAGVWFIGTVVLLLLALVTRPSPRVRWSGAAKAVTASLSILAFIWPIVSASRPPSSSTPGSTPGSGNGAAAAAGGPWQIDADRSPMDGSRRIVISRKADNDIAGWLQSKRPTLIVRCQEGRTEAYIQTGMAASVEYDTDSHTVRVRFDERKPTTQQWSESTDHEALFAPSAIQFAKALVNAKTLTFQFTPFNASPAVVHFNVEGLRPYLNTVASACGWQVAGETKTEGARQSWGEGEAAVISSPEGAHVISSPEGAYVTVDGGTWNDNPTPLTISLTPGTHQLRIEKKGYRTEEVPVLIKAGETANVEVTLVQQQ